MSARAWQRRRRNKYLRTYINQIWRDPDRIIILPGGGALMSNAKYTELLRLLDEVEQIGAELAQIEAAISNQ